MHKRSKGEQVEGEKGMAGEKGERIRAPRTGKK